MVYKLAGNSCNHIVVDFLLNMDNLVTWTREKIKSNCNKFEKDNFNPTMFYILQMLDTKQLAESVSVLSTKFPGSKEMTEKNAVLFQEKEKWNLSTCTRYVRVSCTIE